MALTNALSDTAVVGAMFLVVLEMKDQAWRDVEKILAVHFFMLMQFDEKWRVGDESIWT